MFCKADQTQEFMTLENFLGHFLETSAFARILRLIAMIGVQQLLGAPDARKSNRNAIWLNAHPWSSI